MTCERLHFVVNLLQWLGFSGTLCCIQGEENTKETLCEGLCKGVVEEPFPVISKLDAEHMPLNPDTKLSHQNQRSTELDRSSQCATSFSFTTVGFSYWLPPLWQPLPGSVEVWCCAGFSPALPCQKSSCQPSVLSACVPLNQSEFSYHPWKLES